mmetsp:Transcript_1951/g.7497  ORF Transcript_1951/g.7497 Transcript_1951/m.7497 type:complete len:202 (+) Transcript_1951:868-1473(+)
MRGWNRDVHPSQHGRGPHETASRVGGYRNGVSKHGARAERRVGVAVARARRRRARVLPSRPGRHAFRVLHHDLAVGVDVRATRRAGVENARHELPTSLPERHRARRGGAEDREDGVEGSGERSGGAWFANQVVPQELEIAREVTRDVKRRFPKGGFALRGFVPGWRVARKEPKPKSTHRRRITARRIGNDPGENKTLRHTA